MNFHRVMRRIRKWFLTGLLAAAPVGITLALVWAIVSFTDDLLKHLLPHGYEPSVLLGHEVPGLGLFVAFIALTLIGALISNFLGRYFIRLWDRFIARVPIINKVYVPIKQVLDSVLSENGTSFREVVYIEFPQPGQYAIAFVVGPAGHMKDFVFQEPMVAVFVPTVPMPTTGYLLNMAESKLIKSDLTVEEGLKLIITLGMVGQPARAD